MDDKTTEALEAAAFRRLVVHLQTRSDVQNIDMMILAGFCRNCLGDWYREAAAARGIALDKDEARGVCGKPEARLNLCRCSTGLGIRNGAVRAVTNGGRYRDRTYGPYHVKVVLSR